MVSLEAPADARRGPIAGDSAGTGDDTGGLQCAVHLPEYLAGFRPPLQTSPLVDATSWVGDELFWPAYLLSTGAASTALEAFNADPADLEAYLDNFERPDRWPVFTVPLATGTMRLIICNLPDDAGIHWQIDAEVEAAIRRLADEDGGYFAGPGLPWPLLPSEPADLLLALPAIGDHTVPDDTPIALASVLRAVGATALVEELTAELLQFRACVLQQ
jgi:hypothetical protein